MTDKLARFYPLRTAVRKPAISAGKVTVALIALAAIVPYATVAGATLIALPLAYKMIVQPGVKSFKQNSFLSQYPDNLAHLVPTEVAMIDYIKIVGRDEAVNQVERAFRHGVDLTEPATKLLAKYAEHFDPKQLDQYLEGLDKSKPFKSADDGAIETKAKPIEDQDGKAKSTTKGDTAIEKVSKDVVTAFLEDLRCTVLCAPPRTGKGIVAAGMMIGFKSMYPAGKLFSCTIKQFKGEDWYFSESDYHINPDRRNPVALAITLYELYRAWESSNSNPESPSLFVLDEIRDTLLAIENVKTEDVDPELAETHPKFADWFRGELISAATLNQCHKRFVVLISPVSTATAMGFKDANSLNSYASFTLVTPSELAFSEGNNGTFSAPAIRPDSPLFDNWYGLAWGKKTKSWLGVPTIDAEVIKLRESNPPKLNYFSAIDNQATESQIYFTGSNSLASSATSTSTVSKLSSSTKVEPTQEELENLVYTKIVDKIIALNGEKTTLSKLRRTLSTKQQKAYTQLTEDLILEDERFDFSCRDMPDGNKSISIWLITDSTNNNVVD